jgi:hypothetical protein
MLPPVGTIKFALSTCGNCAQLGVTRWCCKQVAMYGDVKRGESHTFVGTTVLESSPNELMFCAYMQRVSLRIRWFSGVKRKSTCEWTR